MPKKRVADIARERGLEPAEVARRLAEAGVKLSGDAVDEAAAARALGGSRPARSKIATVAAAPPRVPVPTAPVGSSRPSAAAAAARPAANGPAGAAPARPAGAPGQAPRPGGRVDGPGVTEGGGARPRPGPGTPGSLPPRLSRPQRAGAGATAGRRRRVVIDTGAARPARDTRNQGRGRGRGGHSPDKREEPAAPTGPVTVPSGVTVKDLAMTLSVSTAVIQKTMMGLGELVGITQSLTDDAVELIGTELEREITITHAADEVEAAEVFDDEAGDLEPRAPVVTIMGHVDHGKTSLLDAIRETSVVSTEAGGITQHIGAYQATVGEDGRRVTFLDTPGHEAFTAMRARGANATDIVVLVVAADDGVMPQTIEAIDHAKAAEVPIVVAVNKIDRPDANPERVRQELTSHGLQPEEWGGQTIFVDVSAREKTGLSNLLEMLLLQADVLELKANPTADASGLIIESRLDIGRGPVATLLVQRGTMHPGVAVVAGDAWGKVRAMYSDTGARLKDAGPAVPVEILGFDHPPVAGERARVVDSERTARQQAQQRAQRLRAESLARRQKTISLEHLFDAVKAGGIRELNLIIKADVQGSVEAALGEVQKIKSDEVAVRVIHTGVGAIVESDINLAAASTAIVVGFNVRPNAEAKALADREGVDVRTYRVIYQLTEDIEKALVGLLAPDTVEDVLGEAEVRALFRSSRLGVIAGCMVTTGKFERSARVRVVREGALVWDGNIGSLRRVQEDVREVSAGFECGILLEGYNDLKEGDVLECYVTRQVERSSLASVAGAST
jgi:translation initiation factor IF-2